MLATNIPYLYSSNGIYYYRNNSVWKSLRTCCKQEAFRKVSYSIWHYANCKQYYGEPNNGSDYILYSSRLE